MTSAVTHLYFISYIHLRVCDSLDRREFLNVDDIIIIITVADEQNSFRDALWWR